MPAPASSASSDPRTHLRFLDHAVVQTYVSLRAFGDLTAPLDAVVAEIRSRTSAGAVVYSPGCGTARDEIHLARALPDREFLATDPSAPLVEAARETAARGGIANLRLEVAALDEPPLEGESCDVITCLRAVHHVRDLEGFWRRCRKALRRAGVVLAQEYVGPPGLQWNEPLRHLARDVLDRVVPERLRDSLGVGPAPPAPLGRELAPRSDQLIATCLEEGFEFTGTVDAGCGLLHPLLLEGHAAFTPTSWQDNLVLAHLFREEAEEMARGTLASSYAMFVAVPR